MTTYLMRHGCTAYSRNYRVNGDPTIAVPLEPEGVQQCHAARSQIPIDEITGCFTSAFGRTVHSARLVLGGLAIRPHRLPGLNELNYGSFEGSLFQDYAAWLRESGPWERPPDGTESQREALARMLKALRRTMTVPGARLVVSHGLLVSVVQWAFSNDALGTQCFFPEARCAVPLAVGDLELMSLIDRILGELYCDNQSRPSDESGQRRGSETVGSGLPQSARVRTGSEALPKEEGTSDA